MQSAATAAQAQSKKSAKQAASLEKTGQASKAAIQDVVTSFTTTLAGYNSIIDGTAKDTQKAEAATAKVREMLDKADRSQADTSARSEDAGGAATR